MTPNELLPTVLILLPLVLAAALVIYHKRWLTADALASAPNRPLGLGWVDLLVVMLIMALCQQVAPTLLEHLGIDLPATPEQAAELGPRQIAVQMLLSQGLMQLPAVLYILARLATGRSLATLGLHRGPWTRQLRRAGVALALMLPMVLAVNVLVAALATRLGNPPPDLNHQMLDALGRTDSPATLVLIGLSAVILAPVLEEMIFRGLMQTVLAAVLGREHRRLIVVLASILFAVIHLGMVTWHGLPGLLVIGLALGWLYERTGSLTPPILLHAGFNAANIALALITRPPGV
ncbi:MAG: CPBP family intramembrane metalloprotease [Phycisphaeraceae bacterium]|nr:CPBP family intramembrane metalloprotease [Phycisphaeraceae bacterium]